MVFNATLRNALACLAFTPAVAFSDAPTFEELGFEAIDPQAMVYAGTGGNNNFVWHLYEHPTDIPGGNKYVRPDAPSAPPYNQTSLLMRKALPTAEDEEKLGVIVWFDPFIANPDTLDVDPLSFANNDYVTVRTRPGHFPNIALYREPGTTRDPMDWGGFAKGDSNRWRFGAGVAKLAEDASTRDAIDWDAGVHLWGQSYGGTTAILQSLLLKDPAVQTRVTVVNARVPNTLFVRQDTTVGATDDGIDQRGAYYKDAAFVQLAWDDPTNAATADIIANADDLKGVYYAIFGQSEDKVVTFDLAFFSLFCEAKKIACMGAWTAGGHSDGSANQDTKGGYDIFNEDRSSHIGLPRFAGPNAGARAKEIPFSGPDSASRLDKILPVFTNSSANFFSTVPGQPGYLRGHYNLGLEWNSAAQSAPTEYTLSLPIRYRRHENFGVGTRWEGATKFAETDATLSIPDQPPAATFDITLRRTGDFALPVGNEISYRLPAQGTHPEQTGSVFVTEAGEVTIEGLTLDSSENYTVLTLSDPNNPPPGCQL